MYGVEPLCGGSTPGGCRRGSESSRARAARVSRLRKPLTDQLVRGRPSGLVETAATKGVLPGAPRPRLPPARAPPR